jgi:hypothetical protein
MEGDLEAGLGRDLPLAQWYSIGGPGFLSGSRSAEFLTPNFAVFRLGAPVRVFTAFGANLQVIPRVDVGYIGSDEPGKLQEGARFRGASLTLRTELGRWFGELSVGRALSDAAAPLDKVRLNVLLGTHPFDLWRQRD